ncbi:MAG: ABC transporter ATP-binding protein [Lachnospiraceae bacterium]|nr:ABC transporter ATP-binding protein [Lachnospiraceae bacterium]
MGNVSENKEVMIQLSGVKKKYRLGQIGGGTLQADLQSWWARIHGKEDPNSKIGADQRSNGETFMALNGIDLTIYKGEAVGIIGSNGAGKSTLLKLLSRVTAPTEGEIDIYGRIASMLEVGTGFSPEMTGRENVYMNGTILGMTKAEIDAKMEDIIEFSEVREFIDTPVKRYSSGMYVKLAFSVATHLDSEIMIMDEVLAVGDMAFQKKCLDKMREAAKKEGRTVLYVSHNMNTIRQLCDRCIVLDKGKVIFEGDVEKGIVMYMNNSINLVTQKVYDNYERMRFIQRDDVRIISAEYIGKDNCIFENDENIKLRLKWKYNRNTENMSMRFVVESLDNSKVCASFCYHKFSGVENQVMEADFEYEINNLAPGNYQSFYVFFESNKLGASKELDWVPGLCFTLEKKEEGRLPWRTQAWGYYEMNPPKVVIR